MFCIPRIVLFLAFTLSLQAAAACAPIVAPPSPTKSVAAVPADIPSRNWKMSTVTGEDSSWTKGARLFAERVRERTGGKINIAVYPNGELAGGDQVKELQMLQSGDINFTYHSNLLYTNLDHSLAAISLPWMFNDYAQADAALAGAAGAQLLKAAEAKGIVGLAFGENGFRQLTNNKLAVRKPDDLRGLKIRIPGVKMYSSIYNALGANPVAMNFGEALNALKQGTIDGQENPIDVIVSSKVYESQKHITMWNYSYDALILGISKQDWEGLPQSARDIVKQAAVEASKEQVRLSREAARTQVGLLRDKGMTVTELTPDEIKAFRDKMVPVYAEWTPQIGEALVQQLQRR
ncbi:MAG: DctP family TRAP transporter solute-binding subunit [Chloroflexi bacterium]|nr:DctP family TRAP transporter solute-binding subunit [Chloroflexota bacterium]